MPKFTNISNGPRGLWTVGGLVMVEAGQTTDDVELAKGEEVPEDWFAKPNSAAAKEAVAEQDPLDHDGDGKKGGAAPAKG